jgi:uncharacterized membrane protein
MDPTTLVLAVHAFATLAMTGLIWFVQIVHYPLLAQVGRDAFVDYEARHIRLTTAVVAPLMLTEAATAVWLLLTPVPRAWSGAGILLLLVVWISTAAFQVPCHRRLEQGYDLGVIRRLVATNWIRTVAWTARSGIALWLLL